MKASRVLEKVFSIRNSEDKRRKVVTIFGAKIKMKRHIKDFAKKYERYKLMNDKSLYIGIPDNLTLALSFNSDCNLKCKFCFEEISYTKDKLSIMPHKWLYDDMTKLYPKTAHIIPTYGELAFRKEGYEYIKYLHENYPHINILMESNGLAFDDKWAQLASDNLIRVNFSINAINEEYFEKTVMDGNGALFRRIQKNVEHYLEVLKERGMFAFKPSVSCVINSTNYEIVEEFISKWVSKGIQNITIFFDVYDNETYTIHKVKDKTVVNEVVIKLLELNRVLENKVYVFWQCFIPINNVDYFEKMVYERDIDEIRAKYPKLVEAIKDFESLDELHAQRTAMKKEFGKKAYNEDTSTFYRKIVNGISICANPWRYLRLRPNGNMAPCCWVGYPDNINRYIENGDINWEKVFNCEYFRELRRNFVKREYCWKWGGGGHCMPNCPASL